MTNEAIIRRWNKVMCDIGVEYNTIDTKFSELGTNPEFAGIVNREITIDWMDKEACYWRGCYDECGNVRSERDTPEARKIWKSESCKLDRLIAMLEKEDLDRVVARV